MLLAFQKFPRMDGLAPAGPEATARAEGRAHDGPRRQLPLAGAQSVHPGADLHHTLLREPSVSRRCKEEVGGGSSQCSSPCLGSLAQHPGCCVQGASPALRLTEEFRCLMQRVPKTPAEPLGWWIHKASLLERAFLRPPFRGAAPLRGAHRGSKGHARGPGPLPAEPARCPSGGEGSRLGGDSERPPCARGRPGLRQEDEEGWSRRAGSPARRARAAAPPLTGKRRCPRLGPSVLPGACPGLPVPVGTRPVFDTLGPSPPAAPSRAESPPLFPQFPRNPGSVPPGRSREGYLPCPGPGEGPSSVLRPEQRPGAPPEEVKPLLQMSRHNSWFVRLHRTRIAFGQSGAEIPIPGSRDLPGGIRLEPGKEGHTAPEPAPAAPRSHSPAPPSRCSGPDKFRAQPRRFASRVPFNGTARGLILSTRFLPLKKKKKLKKINPY
ncbi:basic proline-rich protein-like [Manacus candei]|uniref:basic proline-rich protein-like n=1 Tax=Manacus candei TaxID=415023 RepID=UPI0022268C0F|nr:basic proline-rich protein-like [Manacus candei]